MLIYKSSPSCFLVQFRHIVYFFQKKDDLSINKSINHLYIGSVGLQNNRWATTVTVARSASVVSGRAHHSFRHYSVKFVTFLVFQYFNLKVNSMTQILHSSRVKFFSIWPVNCFQLKLQKQQFIVLKCFFTQLSGCLWSTKTYTERFISSQIMCDL